MRKGDKKSTPDRDICAVTVTRELSKKKLHEHVENQFYQSTRVRAFFNFDKLDAKSHKR